MRRNRRPHAMRVDGLPIPKDGIRIAHHSQMHKIDKLARRNDVLRSIEAEYSGLDRHARHTGQVPAVRPRRQG